MHFNIYPIEMYLSKRYKYVTDNLAAKMILNIPIVHIHNYLEVTYG